MIRTAFALLALATLAKNDVSGRARLADACAGILRAFVDDVSESHAQRFAPMVSVCPSRNALAMSGIGSHLFHDVHAGIRVVGMEFSPGPLNNFTDTFTKSLITSAAYWKSFIVSSTYNLDNY